MTPILDEDASRMLLSEGGLQYEEEYAVLFPWFALALGVAVFFLLTRYCPKLPFTGIMFLVGTCMGIGATKTGNDDQLTSSILMWDNINGEVLLLVFLPGLIFKDAFSLDLHLFQLAINQCLLFAFPMMLGGTVLTACVAYFVFPYSWSWNLAMTFGAILSATDPVAVNVLLNELGAPPRLKIHVSGESLLNDGSSIVFYSIFSAMFLHELNIPGVGETYDVADGFKIFFREALGGTAFALT